jgi:hypothetical protein
MLDQGESMVTQLNYAPLPGSVSEKVKTTINQIH